MPTHPAKTPTKPNSNIAGDLREVLFTIYDAQSVLAGGQETRLEPELNLLRFKVEKLVQAGHLDPHFSNKVLPAYLEAARKGDGDRAHFWSRMLFREVVDSLQRGYNV